MKEVFNGSDNSPIWKWVVFTRKVKQAKDAQAQFQHVSVLSHPEPLVPLNQKHPIEGCQLCGRETHIASKEDAEAFLTTRKEED